jgi:hypothetical protein
LLLPKKTICHSCAEFKVLFAVPRSELVESTLRCMISYNGVDKMPLPFIRGNYTCDVEKKHANVLLLLYTSHSTVELHLSGRWLSESLGPPGKFVENCTKLACLEIADCRIKYYTLLIASRTSNQG